MKNLISETAIGDLNCKLFYFILSVACMVVMLLVFDAIALERVSADHPGRVGFVVTEREEKVPKPPIPVVRAPEQQKRLDEFCYQIFDSPIFDADKSEKNAPKVRNRRITPKVLLEQFGDPVKRTTKPMLVREPGIDEGDQVVWYYPGMILEMTASSDTRDMEASRPLAFERVTIFSPEYELKHGLRIGQPKSEFIAVLGPPDHAYKNTMGYHQEGAYGSGSNQFKIFIIIRYPYAVAMEVDAKGHISKIEWTWYMS